MHWGVDDQTIQEFEDQLFSQILFAQSKFNCVRAPDPQRAQEAFTEAKRMQSLRGCDFELPALLSGNGHGPFVELQDGSVKLDLIGGIGPYLLGHSHPLQIRAHLKAARASMINSTNFLPVALATETAQTLIGLAQPSNLEHCWFCGSGSMANDSALRLISHHRKDRNRLIAFKQSFAGRSIGMQSITLGSKNENGFAIDYITFPDDEKNTQTALKELRDLLKKHPSGYAAFHGELLQGEAGIHLPHPAGIKEVLSVVKDNDITVWIDEVQTFARTPTPFIFQVLDLSDVIDICTIGKAFNLSAVLFSSHYKIGAGLGGTFQGPVAALVYANDMIRLLTHGNFFTNTGRIAKIEDQIRLMFSQISQEFEPRFKFLARGLGTMWALEVGKSDLETINRLISDLFKNGVMLWRAGRDPYYLRLLLPVTITPEHIVMIKDIFTNTLNQAKYLE